MRLSTSMCPYGAASNTTATAACSTKKPHCKACMYEHTCTILPLGDAGEAAALLRLKRNTGPSFRQPHFNVEH